MPQVPRLRLRRPSSIRVLTVMTVILFYGSLLAISMHTVFDDSGSGGGTAVGTSGQAGGLTGGNDDTATGATDSAAEGGTAIGTDGSATGATGSGGSGTASGVGGTGTGPGSGAVPSGGAGASTPRAGGPPLLIGVHDDSTAAAGQAYGVKGLSETQVPWIKKIVAWINANGGMGGRPLEIWSHTTDSVNGTFDQQTEQACVDFTEDHHVVAVVSGARTPTLNLVDCLARHKTPLVWDYHFMADQATLDRYANYLYMPTMVRAERLGTWIDAVADAKFFDKGTIGLVRYDEPLAKRLSDQVIKPHLAARGLQVKSEVAFRPATGAASSADLAGQANNAVLRFQADGVNRVVFAPTSAVMPLLFFTAAESQHYRPRYTYTSYDVPSFQTENTGPEQLTGSLAFGWLPAGDTMQPQQPPLNPTARRCVQITSDAQPPGNGNIRRYCDALMFLKAAFDRGVQPTPSSMRSVIDGIGGSWESPWTFKTVIGPSRHDGASVGRLVAYDTACECYQYTGGEVPIP